MTDNNTLADYNFKSFDESSTFVYCDVCAFEGYPYEKVVFKYTGFRSEEEDGFAYKYTVNQFQNPDRIHIHRSSSKQLTHKPRKISDQITLNGQLKESFQESCTYKVCMECRNDHSFKGDFAGAITFIDLLPELFPEIFREQENQRR